MKKLALIILGFILSACSSDLEDKGFERILKENDGVYSKHGWNHYGPGYFELDSKSGILTSHGGMGLFWYSLRKYKDFVLELEYKCSEPETNSGIFLRVPETLKSNEYIYHSFEVQINDTGEGIHSTGAVYDAEPPSHDASNAIGDWNHYRISYIGSRIQVELNGEEVVAWDAEPKGKIKDFASEGYIGLQNHDWDTSVSFRNIYVKALE
jgi:hypothetical protein